MNSKPQILMTIKECQILICLSPEANKNLQMSMVIVFCSCCASLPVLVVQSELEQTQHCLTTSINQKERVGGSLVICPTGAVVEAVPACVTPSYECLSVLRPTPSSDSKRVMGGLDQKSVTAKKKTNTQVVATKGTESEVCQQEHSCGGIQD